MAKNWTMAEAAKAVKENDMVGVADLGKRFPLMMHFLEKGIAGDGEAVAEIFMAIPEYLTANKVNTAIKNALGDVEDVEDAGDEEAEEKPAKKPVKKADKKAAEAEDEDDADDAEDDYESMNGSKLYELCKERGILKNCKTKKKADLIVALREADANGDDEEDEEDEEVGAYDGMSAQELFKECKKTF